MEDDRDLSKGISIALQKDGHEITPAYSYNEAVKCLDDGNCDLYLLDINLPGGDGLAFCERVRRKSEKPIIFLTARDTEDDMLAGFTAGCDDYIAKPFSVSVLRQKILAILKRNGISNDDGNGLTYRDLKINYDKMTVTKNGKDCRLTATEYKLLEYMAKNKGKVLTRTMLLEQIWDVDGNFIDENTLSVHIKRLRGKLEDNSKNPEYILTIFGIGYTFGD